MLKALIFDLDNTLVFAEKANYLAYKEACDRYGFKINEKNLYKAIREAQRWDEFLPSLTGTNDLAVLEKIVEAKKELYPKYFGFIIPNESLFQLIEFAQGKLKTCVATSASRVNAENVLKNFKLIEKIDVLITGDDVSKAKPDPEIFLKAAELLGVKPEECLVFEDADNGVAAARAAGMHCVKIAF